MVEYNTINVKVSDSQLNKLKSAVKNKQVTTPRMSARMFNRNNLPNENNMETDIKLSKAQISKIIQSGGFLSKLLVHY